MSEERQGPLYVRAGFYVRPDRTLAECSVRPGVGGPGSVLWRGGWSLGIGSRALAGMAPADLPRALMGAFLAGEDLRLMTQGQKEAWIRTWRPGGP